MVVTKTERLILRHLHSSDLDAMLRVFGDAVVMRYSDHGVRDETWVRGWIEGCLESYRVWGFGKYAVLERESQQVIGYCGLTREPDLGGQPEVSVGYRLARSAWGRGYATEAVRAVLDYAFGGLGLARVVATIDPNNLASVRVAEKAGMRYEKDVTLEGYDHPDHLFVIAL